MTTLPMTDPKARVWATFARHAGAPASWNIARRMPKADAEAMAENSRQQASARSVAVEFGVHVSDQAPR
jgi:hypothetical protein